MSLNRAEMLQFVKCMIKSIKPAYGIGYPRQRRMGPTMYVRGICQGFGPQGWGIRSEMSSEETAEADKISRWGNGMTAEVWKRGLLRDVYLWNFLSDPHLRMTIGTVSLEQWIRADGRRGQLESLDAGLWFWEVAAANLEPVRMALVAANIIFDLNSH